MISISHVARVPRNRATQARIVGGTRVLSLVIAAILLASCSSSGGDAKGKVTSRLKIERYTLANGLEVVLHEDHTTPKAAVTFLVRTGSKDEPDRRSGFAHLFEHLMFMGTKRVPQGEYDKIIESVRRREQRVHGPRHDRVLLHRAGAGTADTPLAGGRPP